MPVLTNGAIFFCQVFAGLPVKYRSRSADVPRLVFSPTIFRWSLIVTVLQTVILGLYIYNNFIHNFPRLPSMVISKIIRLALTMDLTSAWLTGIILFNSYARKYSKFIDLLKILEKFDNILQISVLQYWPSVPIAVLFPFIAILFEVGLYIRSSTVDVYSLIGSCVFVSATFCRRTGMLLHFQQVTFGIAKRFRLINTKIRQEVMIQSFRLPVQQEVHIFQELTSYKKIRLLMGTHQLLSDAVYEANLFYNDQLLASIICSLCNVTAALFMLLQHASIPNLVGIAKTSLWILFITYFLVMITISSSSVTEASHETAQIVRKLASKNLNPELKDLLESFMLQLVSQNNTFSAMGYFQVNKENLTSIVATVATYLVVLLQFQTQST
ncbi:gustatory receptor [Homalodisca vitripennis]|nr:gustatory receptor [Homalodisca vitripennis]